ncbi:MAG: hypothetical protein SPJ62_09650 [Inconstantimicrobium porci]|uniref:hypothetical protein n=1 Tax=Inconstantimicrobium porci TaxID=2652291 RepID=UPI00240A57CE|nr:hypothetical protein [Inconstantimicrobium porci]MDD6771137.1 hypothetical protein [Inconstantimicrobium porci]MDY5912250.1 hypothetical protein [Inconstantimicrobium porci]
MEKNTNDLFELMSKMYSEMQSMKSEMTDMRSEMTDMKSDISNMRSEMTDMKSDISNMKKDISKNSILLEKLDSNVKLLAEGQHAFKEELGRNTSDDKKSINDRIEIIEQAVTYTAKEVTNLADTIEVVKDTAASNNMDIKILRKIQSHSGL